MKQILLSTFIAACLAGSALVGQNPGDQATAGFTNSRTYLNSDAGDFKPPLELVQTLALPEGFAADNMSIFEQYILLGQSGESGRYLLLDRQSGVTRWSTEIGESPSLWDFGPAFDNDIVLLGGATTTSTAAVQVSTGATLWVDDRVGTSNGHSPLLTGSLALFAGRYGVVAARASDGFVLWQDPSSEEIGSVELARAPLSTYGSRVYGLAANGSLFALDLRTGAAQWSTPDIGGDRSDVIATRKYVFVTSRANRAVSAVRTSDGSVAWSAAFDGSFGNPGIALAYNRLFVFYVTFHGGHTEPRIAALNPQTGETLWETIDSSIPHLEVNAFPIPPSFGQIANNAVYFYNAEKRRICALDAFSGNTLWSIGLQDVAGLSVANDALYVLQPDQIQIYRPANTVYLPQIADGIGASTLITLANLSSDVAEGMIEFLDDDGNPLQVPVENEPEPTSSLSFQLQPNEALAIQTTGVSDPLSKGWARVTASRPVAGTAIYQVRAGDTALFEAGVGAAQPTGRASIFVSTRSSAAGDRISTGIAFANPLNQRATVELIYPLGPVVHLDASITLEPGQHLAEFIDELFPDLANVDATGTLIVSSEVPVVATALRTQNGYPLSSYPVGIP